MRVITSKLKLVSGLHIGGGDDSMKIGGVDSPVIKREVFCDENGEVGFKKDNQAITEPYIPGSSLKGKIRSLLEHYFKLINPTGEGKIVESNSDFGSKAKIDLIVKLFGESAENIKKDEISISRLIFRDNFISNDIRVMYLNNKISFSEEKAENKINRLTGSTEDGGLRFIERVPSGVEFDFEVVIRSFDGDDIELFEDTIRLGLKLLELDTLGGSGSRGYGKVEFLDIEEKLDDLIKKVEAKLK